ncbi:hypothetical protein JXB31_00050 [Candidatus Woesearchaeota archaeon]|nr:hypothetical protein [Candidatus Woesearchaeota archaeon]
MREYDCMCTIISVGRTKIWADSPDEVRMKMERLKPEDFREFGKMVYNLNVFHLTGDVWF